MTTLPRVTPAQLVDATLAVSRLLPTALAVVGALAFRDCLGGGGLGSHTAALAWCAASLTCQHACSRLRWSPIRGLGPLVQSSIPVWLEDGLTLARTGIAAGLGLGAVFTMSLTLSFIARALA